MVEVLRKEVRRFIEECLEKAGAPKAEAQAHADLLLHADTAGHFSHGLNRLVFYINDITSGATNPSAVPSIIKESTATALVDGKDALGATVGNFCMELAIRKAKEAGIGWVSAKGATHFGMAGYWALKAEKQGLIGLAFTNSSPIMVPTRAKERALGTNPIGMAAPAKDGDSLVVDMAMTSVALGKIEVQIHKEEPIPEGWALGPDGRVTTDAQVAFDTGHLLPLGGFEDTSGYKGYGLAAMVEVFCSVLSGILPEALRTKCVRCTERQKRTAVKVIKRLKYEYPNEWAKLSSRWDPTGDFTRFFEDYLAKETFNTISGNGNEVPNQPPSLTPSREPARPPPPPSPSQPPALPSRPPPPPPTLPPLVPDEPSTRPPSSFRPPVELSTSPRPVILNRFGDDGELMMGSPSLMPQPGRPVMTPSSRPAEPNPVYTMRPILTRPTQISWMGSPSDAMPTRFPLRPNDMPPPYTTAITLIDQIGYKIIRTTELVTDILRNTVRAVVGR